MAKGHGGKREGAGRKPKEANLQLVENLSNVIDPTEPIEALAKLVKKGNIRAIELYFAYFYGKPHQSLQLDIPDGGLNIIVPPSGSND